MEQRQLYLDLLRVISIFAVIVIHVSAPLHDLAKMPTDHWITSNILDSISRFCVPVFFMVSGTLLLGDNRNYQFSYLFRKRILRILVPFIIWSLFYLYYFQQQPSFDLLDGLYTITIKPTMYHLWFVYPLIGLYLLIPILGFFASNADNSKLIYFFVLWAIFAIFNPLLQVLTGYSLPIFSLSRNLGDPSLFSGYFVLGFYLSRKSFNFNKLLPFLLIIGGIIITILATDYFSYKQGKFYDVFYRYTTPNVLMVSIGIFLLFQMLSSKLETLKPMSRSLLIKLSEVSFGIYLMHIIILNQVNVRLHLDGNTFHPAIGILLTSICVFAISAILTYMIRQIPFIGKWVT
jgi:surface polysaccharide O-acyltransferase-like enzyme